MFSANVIFILSMRIIIEICFLKLPFFYLHIYHFAGFNVGIFLVVLTFQKVFIRWTRYCMILKFHMIQMLMKFRCSVCKVGRWVWMDIITAKKKNKVEVYIRNISLKTLFCLFIITHSSQFNINIYKVWTGLLIH